MRTKAPKWVVQIFLALLVLSFAVWGIGDIFRAAPTGSVVAEVAGAEVTVTEVNREFEVRYRDLQQQLGGGFDRRQAIGLGLMQQALQTAIARRLVQAHARDLELMIADETLAREVRANPVFHGPGGFDRGRFELVVRSSGLSEEAFLEALRSDMLRERLLGGLTAPLAAPLGLVRQLHAFEGEQRTAQALVVPYETAAVGEPDDATLEAYREANAERWQAPEYRNGVVVALRAQDLADEIEVSEDAVREEYEDRLAEFRTPERREVEQLLAADEGAIREAAELVASGRSLPDAAEALAGRGVQSAPLGTVTRGLLPDPLDGAIFALGAGEVSAPVQSPFGWHLFRVAAIEAESVVPLAEKRDELHRELALRQAADQLPALGNALEDEIAAGTPLEEAASQLGLTAVPIEAVDSAGRDRAGTSILGEWLTAEIVQSLFTGIEGRISPLEETPAGVYYVYRIDRIEPGRPRTLDEVRSEVEAAWRREQQEAEARRQAEALLERAKAGEPLATLASETPGLLLRDVAALRRADNGFAQLLNPAAVAALFAAEPGGLVPEVQTLPDGTGLLRVVEVIPAPPLPENEVQAQRNRLAEELRSDLLGQYEAALRLRYPVQVNEQVLASLMQSGEP